MASGGASNIRVFLRPRPLEGVARSVVARIDAQTVETQACGHSAAQRFSFDEVFCPNDSQEEVYEVCGKPLVADALRGFNCTVFAYGQTGSGKTHCVFGPENDSSVFSNENIERGLLPRMLQDLFNRLMTEARARQVEFLCKGSLIEIYNEKVHDLLDDASGHLQLRESMQRGVYVEGQTEVVFDTAEEALATIRRGAEGRKVGATAMNRESSRSHTVFTLTVESRTTDKDGVVISRKSRVNVVDLAGSERQKQSQATGERQIEANFINKSLLCLGTVISALSKLADAESRPGESPTVRPHIKYRDSKLTFLLRDSLGGNSKTYMIATLNPGPCFLADSLSTLRFAQRAKRIRNNAKINEDLDASRIAALQAEIRRLKSLLEEKPEHKHAPEELDSLRNVELERLEQLLSHALTEREASRKRGEDLENLVHSKAKELEEHAKARKQSSFVVKLKTSQLEHIRKGKVTPALLGEWQKNELEILEQQKNAEAISWRVKFEEASQKMEEFKKKLERFAHLEETNLKLGEEVRALLESKRNLQDMLHANQHRLMTSPGLQTPDSERKSLSGTSTPGNNVSNIGSIASTPARVTLTGSTDAWVCPTPSASDLERAEIKMLQAEKRKILETLHENMESSQPSLELEDLEGNRRDLEQRLNEALTRIDELKSENVRLKDAEGRANREIIQLGKSLDEALAKDVEKEKLREELDNLQLQNDVVEQSLEEFRKELAAEKEAHLAAREDLDNLRASQAQHAKAEEVQEEQQKLLQSEVENLQNLHEAQRKTTNLRIAKLKNDLQEAIEVREEALERLTEVNNALMQYRTSLQKERGKVEEFKAEAERYRLDKEEIEAALALEKSQAEITTMNLHEARDEVMKLNEARIARERRLIAELASQQAQLRHEQALREELVDEEEQARQMHSERSLRLEAEARVVDLQLRNEELSAANAKLAGNQNTKQRIRYVQGLRDEIAALRESEDILKRRLKSYEAGEQVATQPGSVEDLRRQIETLRAANNEELERVKRLEAELDAKGKAFSMLSEKAVVLSNLAAEIKADQEGAGDPDMQSALMALRKERAALLEERDKWEKERNVLLRRQENASESKPQLV